jgi:tetratricopeptide (TPR) repeat protein
VAKLTINQVLQQAVDAHKAGQLQEAYRLYAAILKVQPKHPDANHNTGLLTVGFGKIELALPFFRTALDANPSNVQFWYSHIVALITLERLTDAKALLDQAKNKGIKGADFDQLRQKLNNANKTHALKPNKAEAYSNMGIALQKQNKLEEAIKAYRKALAIKPDYVDVYYNMGIALKGQGKLEKAIEAYNKALAIKPDYVDAYYNMGIALKDQGKLEEAIEAYNNALAIKPNYADAYSNMGNALQDQGKLEEAIEAYRKALAIKPDYVDAYYNMGIALQDQLKLEEAIEAYRKALAIKPDDAGAYYNMGIALHDNGKLEEAIKAYKKAITIKPDDVDVHKNLSYSLLNSARLKEGFEEYEWRWKNAKGVTTKRQFSKPMWDGKETLKGKKVLLWCEQGVGDTINWSSKLPLIASQADHCILECQEKLVPLLSRAFPDLEIKAEDRRLDSKRDDFDFHLPMGSLYKHFISEISENTKPDAFLVPDPVRIKFWRKRLESLGNGPFIGVSWKSADMSNKRQLNYAHISDWLPIFTMPGMTFINLQYIDFLDDINEIKNEFGVTIHNFDDLDHYNDLEDVAALCAALDIVVSTKITVPLISAGVGTITKLANWRQSSWNNILLNPVGPLVDIFEKNTLESWHEVFSAIAEDIMTFSIKYNSKSGSF